MVTPKIFISYSWAQKEHVDVLDGDLRGIGIGVIRDKRELRPLDSIRKFMKSAATEADFIVPVLSPEYLESVNCMFEALVYMERPAKVIPLVVAAGRLRKAEQLPQSVDYWTEQQRIRRTQNLRPLAQEIELCGRILEVVPRVLALTQDVMSISPAELKQLNYLPLLRKIGFEAPALISELLELEKIANLEEKEIALDDFLERHPHHWLAHHMKGMLQKEQGQYIRARHSYLRAIEIRPGFADAHNDYAILLENFLSERAEAESHYKLALDLDPRFELAHNNYGVFLERSDDSKGARAHYEQAISLDPGYVGARMNLATLAAQTGDREMAKSELETVLELDSEYADAHANYAHLMRAYYGDSTTAGKHEIQARLLRARHGNIDRGWRPN